MALRALIGRIAVLIAVAGFAIAIPAAASSAATVAGFTDSTVISGLDHPMLVAFAPNGQIFVAEKRGTIWSYDSLFDTTPTLVADLSTEVDDYWDRGLMGLAVPPGYPKNNHLWVGYAYDAPIGGTAPVWNDNCPSPPGPTTDGCVISGRLSKLTLTNGVASNEQVLINDWCQQFPSHSLGTLAFGPGGYLYVSGGDGASFGGADYGQLGSKYAGDPPNPCGDPPGAAATALKPPNAEGGALRSQSVRRSDGPASLDGAILRLVAGTGAPAPGNPFAASTDRNRQRVLAYGLRNPFRFTFRPGTRQLWVGDVGYNTWEEINRIPDAAASTAQNFGWPCYEGAAPQSAYQSANLNVCNTLPASAVTAPYYGYQHGVHVVGNDGCSATAGSSVSGVAFYTGSGGYPKKYNGALFFADHSRSCMWAMLKGSSGDPDPGKIVPLPVKTGPVDLVLGPDHLIYYVDYDGGAIHRLTYNAPTARITASPASGPPPLTVQFDGSGSTDPGGEALSYAWRFGNGSAAAGAIQTHTYASPGQYTATLTVTDAHGAFGSTVTTVSVGTPPSITSFDVHISDHTSGETIPLYKVGDDIDFSAAATGGDGSPLPASAFSWHLIVDHLDHTHDGGVQAGIAAGSFAAPDHSYPSHLTLALTVTDPRTGLQTAQSVDLQPQTADVTLQSDPGGMTLTADDATGPAPLTVTEIVGHLMTVEAPSPQQLGGSTYTFTGWSDGGDATHSITVADTATTYTATYN